MLEFAVTVEGVTKAGEAQWVLAVDPVGGRLLIVHDDKRMYWHPMAECLFVKVIPPDAPRMVIPVQPQPKQASLAMPNREARRLLEHNGNAR